jgi:hypothetical protein
VKVKIKIRKATAQDWPLVYDSWIRHLCSSSGLYFGQVEQGARRIIDRILRKPGAEVRLAVDADNRERILGLVVVEPAAGVLHYAFTKLDFRQYGVCRELLAGLPPLRVWWLGKGARYVARCAELVYDPVALMEV